MSTIEHVVGREVLDSRGNPTVEVEVFLDSGATRPGHRAVGRVDRPVRGRRAARRRRPLRRQGRARAPSATSTARSRDALDGLRRARPARRRPAADRPRRHRQQGPPRRQRHPRRVARRGQGRGRRARAAAVPLRRRRQRPRAAGADDERAQRRRARRQQRRLPGVHDHAGRRGLASPRRCAGAPRPTTRSRSVLHDRGPVHRRRRRGRLRARPARRTRTPCSCSSRPSSRPASRPASDIAIALDPAIDRVLRRTAAYVLAGEGRTLTPAEMVDYWADLCDRYPIVSIEDGMAEEDWDGWSALTAAARRPRAARGRRPVRHQRRAPRAAASTPAWPTPSSSRSTRSARSPRRSTPSAWPPAPATRR